MLSGCVTYDAKNETSANTAEADAPKVVIDMGELGYNGRIHTLEGKPFTGFAEKKFGDKVGDSRPRPDVVKNVHTFKDGKMIATKSYDQDGKQLPPLFGK